MGRFLYLFCFFHTKQKKEEKWGSPYRKGEAGRSRCLGDRRQKKQMISAPPPGQVKEPSAGQETCDQGREDTAQPVEAQQGVFNRCLHGNRALPPHQPRIFFQTAMCARRGPLFLLGLSNFMIRLPDTQHGELPSA